MAFRGLTKWLHGGSLASDDGRTADGGARRPVGASGGDRTEYVYSRLVNRPVAAVLTRRLAATAVHPNDVTLASFVLFMVGCAVIVLGSVTGADWLYAGAYALLVLGYFLDAVDGQLARARDEASAGGMLLDHGLDLVRILCINCVMGYYLLSAAAAGGVEELVAWLAVFSNMAGQAGSLFSASVRDLIVGSIPRWGTGSRGLKRAAAGLLNVRDYGFFIMLVLVMPLPRIFAVAYAMMGVAYLGAFVLGFRRAVRLAQTTTRATLGPDGTPLSSLPAQARTMEQA